MKTPPGIIHKLEQREKLGLRRELQSYEDLADFISNDYLGLSKKPWSLSQSSAHNGSRLISGTSKLWENFEAFLATYFQFDSALFFNSGFDANLALFSVIPQHGDLILYDELIHASVHDGMKLSKAKHKSFKHNNLEDLKELLYNEKGSSKSIYVAIESVYSMDGDVSPVKEIASLCEKHNAYLIVDEAHAAGYLGNDYKGLSISSSCLIKLVTFSKAYGRHGAVVLSSRAIKDYLINFARSFIYTTALPDFIASSIWELLRDTSLLENSRKKFEANNALFHVLTGTAYTPVGIKTIHKTVEELTAIVKAAKSKGIALRAVLPPTVPRNKERIRLTIHAHNTEKEIQTLCSILS